MKTPPFADGFLRSVAALVPDFHVQIATSTLVRGHTAKGRYDVRLADDHRELRTSFLAKGRNPLKQSKLLLRTATLEAETLQAHAIAIRENETRLPWIRRSTDAATGDDIVTVRPFGPDETAPMVAVRTSARTGFLSLTVENAREMSPAEARLVAKALTKASKLAAASKAEPAPLAVAA